MRQLVPFAAVSALIVSASASAGAILVDDFSSGDYMQSLTAGIEVDQQAGTMLGGERDAGAGVFANPFSQTLDAGVSGGFLSYSAGPGLVGQVALDYDGTGDVEDDALPFETGAGLGDLDLTGYTSIDLDFGYVDQAFELTVLLEDFSTEAQSVTVTVGAGAGVASVALGSYLPGLDLTSIDRVIVIFNDGDTPTAGLDFVLDSIAIVPAPGAALLLGLAGLAGTRRRRG